MELSDGALVQRVLDGDTAAFTVLVDRYHDHYARFARHMLGDMQDAEEALQDAFLRAYRNLPRYEERECFGAWLYRIVVNRCRTMAVKTRTRERTFVRGEEHMLAALEPPADDGAWRDEVDRALAQLPAEQREAFLLKHVEELSYEEMAEILDVGVSALKMRVKRACERLRELLREVPHV